MIKPIPIGIIAATPTDTRFGVIIFRSHGFVPHGVSITHSPQEQTSFQAFNKEELTERVRTNVLKLIKLKVSAVVIYCNSLSGAIDLEYIRKNSSIPIVTPLDVYCKIAKQYSVIGLFAANGQSVANIERLIISKNVHATVVGLGNLLIVKAIEAKKEPKWIIRHFGIASLYKYFEFIGCEIILLACTHFPYFNNELHAGVKIPILDPADEMIKSIQDMLKV